MPNPCVNNPWFLIPKPQASAHLRLFCLPYAGGSATVFRAWPDALGQDVETVLVQLPGRGPRYREAPLTRISAAAQQLGDAIQPLLDKPYVLLGHSLGALISFELIRLLRHRGQSLPLQFFVCARPAPHLANERMPVHALPNDSLVVEVQRRYGGIPPAILADKEMLELFLPILRADLEMLETYHYAPDAPFECGIMAYGGYQDLAVPQAQLAAWAEHTNGAFGQQMFPGNHFFVQNTPTFLKAFSTALAKVRA
jgi:medium-chain acyl-[acyl-carrier-protein] hydrolase